MAKTAYRFVPIDEDGTRADDSQITIITIDDLQPGDRINDECLGYSVWEVVERLSATTLGGSSLLSVCDRSGADIPVAGTVVCRGVQRS